MAAVDQPRGHHREVIAINVPTIVIAGELDRVDSIDLLRSQLLSRIPQAVLHVLPGTGHLSPLEAPPEIARLIGDFSDQVTSGMAAGTA